MELNRLFFAVIAGVVAVQLTIRTRYRAVVKLVIARCSVDYAGRLSAHLPLGTRLLVLKADGSVLVHTDSLGYRPLNWMNHD